MTVRTVKCAHKDNIADCPECWAKFSGETKQLTVDEILATQRHLVEQGFHSRIIADEKIKQALKARDEAIYREVEGEDNVSCFTYEPEDSPRGYPVCKWCGQTYLSHTAMLRRQRFQQVIEREYGNA